MNEQELRAEIGRAIRAKVPWRGPLTVGRDETWFDLDPPGQQRDSFGRVRFWTYWHGRIWDINVKGLPEVDGAPFAVRAQLAYADERVRMASMAAAGRRVRLWPSGAELLISSDLRDGQAVLVPLMEPGASLESPEWAEYGRIPMGGELAWKQ